MILSLTFKIPIVFLIISTLFLSCLSYEARPRQELECAPYCVKIFLSNIDYMNKKLDNCDKRNFEISEMQSQMEALQVKQSMCEKTLQEKETQCKQQEQIYLEMSLIKNKISEISAQPQKEVSDIKTMLREIEKLKLIIEESNQEIKSLQSKLQFNEDLLDHSKDNYILSPTTFKDTRIETAMKVFETSCLTADNSTEIREIKVEGAESFHVPCDGTIAGPGWTVIQRRVDNSVDFNRDWIDYRNGFGDLDGNLFIGLEKIHLLTVSQPHELFINLQNFQNEFRHAHYKSFRIAGEIDGYNLTVLGEYSGDAGNALESNTKMKFTTFDRDNDKHKYSNCAKERHGGWWYNECARSNLNGRYTERELDMWDGIWWWNWYETRTLKSVQMLIRPTASTGMQE